MRALLLFLIFVAATISALGQSTGIAYRGIMLSSQEAYSSRSLVSPIDNFEMSDVVPVLSFTKDVVRVRTRNGADAFLAAKHVVVLGSKMDVKDIFEMLAGYEKSVRESKDREADQERFERIAEPWVRLLDENVKAGSASSLPPPSKTGFTSSDREPSVEIHNDTKYALDLTYTGTTSRFFRLAPGESRTVTFRPGKYRAIVSAKTSSVSPFRGQYTFEPGYVYSLKYYIVTRGT
ncbi:MAG: hypothetical protein LCH41_12760 [Armatimonadetes bacterium]|nr:hypothetical protein [Armatimonadota bacterium]